MKSIYLFLVMMIFQAVGLAAPQTSSSSFGIPTDFRRAIERSQKDCADLRCPQAEVQARLATRAEWYALAKETRTVIHDQVKDRAEDWEDTILEGDFEAKGKTALDAVYFLEQNQKVIGYRFVFSKQAWAVSTCHHDQSHRGVEGCQQGRIVDAAFLSADLAEVFQDEQSYAHFVPSQP